MVKEYLNLILSVGSLGAVVGAAGLWAGAGVDTRPKYRDEQTLIGGTIWSQLIIPIGLIVSKSIEDNLDLFLHAYFLLTGVVICTITGMVLLYGEYKAKKRFERQQSAPIVTINEPVAVNYDKIYLTIGVLSLIAGAFTLINYIILVA